MGEHLVDLVLCYEWSYRGAFHFLTEEKAVYETLCQAKVNSRIHLRIPWLAVCKLLASNSSTIVQFLCAHWFPSGLAS